MRQHQTRRQALKAIGALTIGGALAGCSGDGDSGNGNGGNTVDMTDDLTFEPADITVAVGDTVTWENVGTVPHTVTAYGDQIPDGAAFFASGGYSSAQAARDGYPGDGEIPGGETYSHTFDTAGTYEYFCVPHEGAGMTGTVTVE